MPKRFHVLKSALRYLRTVGSTEGTAVPDAPAGTQLKKFQDFRAGKTIIKITRATDSLPGNESYCSLKPFAQPASDTTKLLVNLSGRAYTNLTETALTNVLLAIDSTPQGTAGLEKIRGFMPAKVTVSITTAGAGTATSSKITGESYKKKSTKTYTFPFGSGGTNTSYKAAKAAIIAAVSTGTANRGVTFKPEKY